MGHAGRLRFLSLPARENNAEGNDDGKLPEVEPTLSKLYSTVRRL
jgi:hypothetical protein